MASKPINDQLMVPGCRFQEAGMDEQAYNSLLHFYRDNHIIETEDILNHLLKCGSENG